MMDIKHHLSDELLMAYASGNLPEAFNLVVATHISMCDECRSHMHSFDAVGGALLEDSDAAPMSEEAMNEALAQIMDLADAPVAEPIEITNGVLPQPLRDYIGASLDDVKWRSVGMGVRQAKIKTSNAASVRLLHIPAGCAVPDHGHRGTELTLVLQGAFRDESDRFGAGDIEIANEDMNHTPVAEEGLDCICLAATDAPLKFNSFLPRIAQRFVGM